MHAAAERVVRLLDPCAPAGAAERAAALLADPPLLAAFFQNADLLHDHGSPRADEVGAWVMRALEGAGPPT